MFREMRRIKQQLPAGEAAAILDRGTSGVLAVLGDDGYPYTVPLSYVSQNDKLYFHCARTGHKLDAIAREDRVSFCVIDQDKVVSPEYTTYFRSVVVFGRARVVEDPDQLRQALTLLAEKYSADQGRERHHQVMDKELPHTAIIELTIEHMTGKEAIELVRAKQD